MLHLGLFIFWIYTNEETILHCLISSLIHIYNNIETKFKATHINHISKIYNYTHEMELTKEK